MIGIQREHVKERIARYREQFPDDPREDWVIGEALGMMHDSKNTYWTDFHCSLCDKRWTEDGSK